MWDDASKPEFIFNFTINEPAMWKGTPVTLQLPQELPSTMSGHGLVLRQVGDNEPLVMFGLRNRMTGLLMEHFRAICSAFGLQPKRNSKQRYSKWSYVAPTIEHFFGNEPAQFRSDLIMFYCSGCKVEMDVDVEDFFLSFIGIAT